MKSPEYSPLNQEEIQNQFGDGSVVYVETEADIKTGESKFQVIASGGTIDKLNQGPWNKQIAESPYFDFFADQKTEEFDGMWHEDIKTR